MMLMHNRRTRNLLLLGLVLLAILPFPAHACGRDSDCVIGGRTYRIALPDGYDGGSPLGVIIFAHGYRGTAQGVMRNRAMTGLASELGVALVAAQADGFDWNIPGAPSADARADDEELLYFDALIEDLTKRFAIDRTRLLVSGFSAGAMVVWNLACYRGASFAGFAPVAGTFWAPMPEACPSGSVNLIHYHGTEDTVVPLQGRKVQNSHQGNVFGAFDLIARSGSYRPAESEAASGLQCNRQVDREGRVLELCLFPGQHELRSGHLARAWRVIQLPGDRDGDSPID